MPDEDDLEPGAPEAQEPSKDDSESERLRKENEKLRKENETHRLNLRRTEVERDFGKDIAELIPDELPVSKWPEYAEKLKTKMPKTEEPQTDGEGEPSQEEPTPQEAALAAVATGSPSSATGIPQEMKSPQEILDIAQKSPEEANRLVAAGRMKTIDQT